MTMPLNGATPEQLRFSSDALLEAERFDRYRTLYARGANAVRTGPAFRAEVTGWRLDRTLLFDRRLNDVGHERPAERLAPDGFDHFTLTLLVSGGMEIDAGWGWQSLQAGELMLLDMLRPASNRMVHAHVITVSLARERIEAASSDVDTLHGMVLPAAQAGLLADYLYALTRRLPGLPASTVPAATQPIATLLAVVLAAGGEALQLPGHADRVRQLVEERLGDPSFTAATAIAASGLSRATLYRLFQPFGGLAVYIRRRRLNRVRAALADPNDARSFAEIALASGFASEGHCNRLFHEAFGARPGEFRMAMMPGGRSPEGRMAYLIDEVR